LLLGCVAPAAPVASNPVAAPAQEKLTYYFVGANISDPFYGPGWTGFQDAAKEHKVKTQFVGPSDLNLASQMATIEQLVAAPDTGGIFLYAMDINAARPLMEQAIAKGIPFIAGASKPPYPGYTAFIGYDNDLLGEQAAEYAVKVVGPKAKVGTIGVIGREVAQRRARFESYLKEKYPDMTVYPTVTHDGSAQGGVKTLDAYLAAHPDMDLIWWADGVSSQMVQPWKEKQAAGVKTKFLAMDMPDPTLQAVKDGVYAGSIGQDTFTEEYFGMQYLYSARHGLRVPLDNYLSAIIVTPANVDSFLKKK